MPFAAMRMNWTPGQLMGIDEMLAAQDSVRCDDAA
jgi:hypothetical protein